MHVQRSQSQGFRLSLAGGRSLLDVKKMMVSILPGR
jgi:hypothetical protein